MPKRSNLRISRRTVEALRVEGRDAVFWDRDLPGFGVRVHRTERKTYVVQTRGPAGLKRVTIGQHGEVTPEQARKDASEVIDRIKRGMDPMPEPPAPEVTIADLAERCVSAHGAVNCGPNTMKKAQLVNRMRHLVTAAARQARSLAPGARATRWNQLR